MALFFDSFSGFDFFSFVVPIFFGIILLIIFGMLGYRLVEGLKNSQASEETVQATLIDKVTSTNHSTDSNGMNSSWTNYTLTFEFATKERKTFEVKRKDYLKYVVGDRGQLSFQRKRFNDFKI